MGRVCLQVLPTLGLQQFQKGSMVMRQQCHNCHSSIYDRYSNLHISTNDHADAQCLSVSADALHKTPVHSVLNLEACNELVRSGL